MVNNTVNIDFSGAECKKKKKNIWTTMLAQPMQVWKTLFIWNNLAATNCQIHARDHFQALAHSLGQPSEMALLFNWDLSICPVLWQIVDLDLLLSGCWVCSGFNIEPSVLLLCLIFTQRPMKDRKMELSNENCFGWVCNIFLQNLNGSKPQTWAQTWTLPSDQRL